MDSDVSVSISFDGSADCEFIVGGDQNYYIESDGSVNEESISEKKINVYGTESLSEERDDVDKVSSGPNSGCDSGLCSEKDADEDKISDEVRETD